jgi:hypothetical protein
LAKILQKINKYIFKKDPLGFGVSGNMKKAAYCDHVGHYKCLIKSIADENCLMVSGDRNL